MLAILGGLGAAVAFAIATLCSARASRELGIGPTLAWVMAVGLLLAVPAVLLAGGPFPDASALGWLVVAGVGNVIGLGLEYAGLRVGKVGVVAPIASTEGAIAALIALALGEQIAPGVGAALAVMAVGVFLAAGGGEDGRAGSRGAAVLALGAALSFGASLYATARVSDDLALAWALLPARLVGTVAVAVPLAAAGRLRTSSRAVPIAVAAGLCEVAGFALFAASSRDGIAVSAVLASQFAGLAALGAYVLFGERLARRQVIGVVAIVCGVAALAAAQS